MNSEDFNFNYSDCVKSYDKWGETTYVNICNGKETTTPWGVSGYGILIALVILGLIGILFIAMIIRMIFDW